LADLEASASKAQQQRVMDLTKKGGEWSRVCESAGKKEKAAEDCGTRRGRIQLELSMPSGFCLALRSTPVTIPMLYLCSNQALLKAVKRWVGKCGNATSVGAPDADILREAIKEF